MIRMVRVACGLLVVVATAAIFLSCGEGDLISEHYRTWKEATNAGAVSRGWLPPFLPESTTEIWETHDLDTNAGAFCFFSPTADLEALSLALESVPSSRLKSIGPWLSVSKSWWPQTLARRRVEEFVRNDGFAIYQRRIQNPRRGEVEIWYFAINAMKGVGYGWFKEN